MKVLNFGSLNIDFVYSVKEFVKPGETISSLGVDKNPGGKGFNQSIALSRAGTLVFHAGLIGEDGLFFKDIFNSVGVDTKFLRVVDIPSGNAIIEVDSHGANRIILYGGANQMIVKDYIDSVLESFMEGDMIILQNEISNLSYIMDRAYEKKMQIVLNPSPMNEKITLDILSKATYIMVNEVEAASITNKSGIEDCMSELRAMFPKAKIVMTLGKEGVLYNDDKIFVKKSAYRVKAVDTTAAGDTFTGYFLSILLKTGDVSLALDMASKASAISVTRKGAYRSIPSLDEVENFKGGESI